MEKCQKWSQFKHYSKWLQMVPTSHIKWYFGLIQQKTLTKIGKKIKSEVGLNIARNNSKWSLIVISSDILAQISQNVDQNWKKAKSKVGSNIAQNDSKWFLIVISSDILTKIWKKGQKWSRFEHSSKWLQMVSNSHIKWYFGPIQPIS